MNWRGLPLLALTGAGCSLLIPLDYTGGKEPSHVNKGGGAGVMVETGGTGLAGEGGRGDAASGGSGAESESGMGGGGGVPGAAGEGTGGDGIGGTGGSGAVGSGATGGGSGGDVTGLGGTGGDTSGSGADSGTGGMANAGGTGGASGGAGLGGASGSGGGGGMNGGMSGAGAAGMAGAAGCNFELDHDAMHCGSCTNACADGVKCEGGQCITAPCVGICKPSTIVPLNPSNPSDGYRVEGMPKAGGCYEVPSYTPTSGGPGIVCWNFVSRSLEVNASTTQCLTGAGAPLSMGERAGGYCVKVGPTTDGCTSCPGFVFPLSSSLPP